MLFIALSVNAQINTNIWGLNVGKSTKKQVTNVLKKKGYKYEVVNDDTPRTSLFIITSSKGVNFNGVSWNTVSLEFYDNTLFGIAFLNNKQPYSSKFDALRKNYDNKYRSYKENATTDYEVSYSDGKTLIHLGMNDKTLFLGYTNLHIFKKVVEYEDQDGASTIIETKDKDEKMFNLEDVTKTVRAGNFKVVLLKDGSVISCNSATGQNSKIHSGGAKDIGFYDIEKCILSIRCNDGTRKRVDLNTGKIVNI